ncbi:hypothetical protein [Enterobacter bugandensis]
MIPFNRLIIVVLLIFFTNVAMAYNLYTVTFSYNRQDQILKCTSVCEYGTSEISLYPGPAAYESVKGGQDHVPFIHVKDRKSVPLLSSTKKQVAMLDVGIKEGINYGLQFSPPDRDNFLKTFDSSCGLNFFAGNSYDVVKMRRKFKSDDGACSAFVVPNAPEMRFPVSRVWFPMELPVTIFNPDSLKDLPPGKYTSELILSVGGHPADIDLGKAFSDREYVIIPIVVNVEQILSFKFLPGAERINLRANWNSPHPQLSGDIKFRFEAFKFSIKLMCGNSINAMPPEAHNNIKTCAITNSESAATPVFIYMNMPNVKNSRTGNEALNDLLVSGIKTYYESSSENVISGTGSVHIRSTPEETKKMLNYPGALYSGTITLLIESRL